MMSSRKSVLQAVVLSLILTQISATGPMAATFGPEGLAMPGETPEEPFGRVTLDPETEAKLKSMYVEALELFQNERFEEALPLVQKVTSEAAGTAPAWYLQGLILANLSRMDEALHALENASRFYEKNAAPLVVMGDILVSLGRRDEAVNAYRAAVDRDPGNWIAQESVARDAEERGDVETAIAHYTSAVEHAPEDRLEPRFRLASLLVGSGRPAEAVEVLEPYVADHPDDAAALAALGESQLAAGDAAAAAESFSAAAEDAAPSVTIALGLARAQKASGEFEAAAKTLAAAREEFADNADIAVELGNLYGALRRYDEAAEVYADGLEAAPDDPRLQKGISIVYQRLGRIGEATDYAAKLAARDGGGAPDLVWLAILQEQGGNGADAIGSYEQALAADPANWLAANNLAALLSDTDPERAVTLASLAVDESDGVPDTRDTLAWAHHRAGDAEAALGVFGELTTEFPQNARFAYRHGRVLLAAGQTEAGRAEIARALDLDPEFDGAMEAREILAQP